MLFTTIAMDELKIRREKKENNYHIQSKFHASLWNRANLIGSPSASPCTSQHETSVGKFPVVEITQRRSGEINRPRNAASPDIKLPRKAIKIGETSSGKHMCFMCPSGVSLEHPMADLLLNSA